MSVLFHDNPGTSLGEAKLSNDSDEILNSPEWMETLFTNNTFLDSPTHVEIRGFCRDVLLYQVPALRVRYWDLAIFVPNILFLIFLLLNIRCVVRKVFDSKSPVLKAFFVLVYMTTIVNVLRCLVSMTITASNPFGNLVEMVLWISLKFFYMTSELSVLTFALLFGQLDSSKSIRRTMVVTLLISLAHTALQTIIELKLIDKSLVSNDIFDLHSEGGLVFWTLTAMIFAMMYIFVLCLPLTCVRKYVTLPSRCSFYMYCILLSVLNLMQALGSALLFFSSSDGMCFIDFSTFLYFCFYTPIVYFTFLRRSLRTSPKKPSDSLFSYKKQRDESGSADLPESYYPRFSGLTSPSYDDLFDCGRDARYTDYEFTRDYLQCPYDTPLMPSETAESTVTTRTGSDDQEHRQRDSVLWANSLERAPRQLKGLGTNGTLVFEETSRWQ